jgi:hypothetical protein
VSDKSGFLVWIAGKGDALRAVSCIENVTQAHGRGLLVQHSYQQRLLTRVVISHTGQIATESQTWDEYWAPVYGLALPELARAVDDLYAIWKRYIASSFSPALQAKYCYHYFYIIDLLLRADTHGVDAAEQHILSTVLGFECFGITSAEMPESPVVGGTITVRNPCYLLSKLQNPDTVDDCRFLPLITAADPSKPQLFYHYRQHKLSVDAKGAILLYVCIDQQLRHASFQTLNTFERQLWRSADPRVESRARTIARGMLLPYFALVGPTGEQPIEVVDLGAGSGLLTARVCQLLKDTLSSNKSDVPFRVWLIDLNPGMPGRFFTRNCLRHSADWVATIRMDYQQWLDAHPCLPTRIGRRIGLIVRSLDSMSNIAIHSVPVDVFLDRLGHTSRVDHSALWKPTQCLSPARERSQGLQVSLARIEFDMGYGFAQCSLSPYFQGLSRLTRSAETGREDVEGSIFLPIRSFNQQCLVTVKGQSVIARMLDECSLGIIQDPDLRPCDLSRHCDYHQLNHLAVLDVGKGLRLQNYYSYLILRRDDAVLPSLTGERVW